MVSADSHSAIFYAYALCPESEHGALGKSWWQSVVFSNGRTGNNSFVRSYFLLLFVHSHFVHLILYRNRVFPISDLHLPDRRTWQMLATNAKSDSRLFLGWSPETKSDEIGPSTISSLFHFSIFLHYSLMYTICIMSQRPYLTYSTLMSQTPSHYLDITLFCLLKHFAIYCYHYSGLRKMAL